MGRGGVRSARPTNRQVICSGALPIHVQKKSNLDRSLKTSKQSCPAIGDLFLAILSESAEVSAVRSFDLASEKESMCTEASIGSPSNGY